MGQPENESDDLKPMFHRGAENVELRGECPRATVDMLDAISMARNLTRTALVNQILGQWAEQERHQHSVVARILNLKTGETDAPGGARK